ncbi:MAG: hypothetical protein ABGY72_13840, partial [bacterium]
MLSADFDLDVDGDGEAEPLSDGLLIQMYVDGMRGEALTARAPGPDATRGAGEIEVAIEALLPLLDVEIDGATSSLSDPRTVLEYLFGVDVETLLDDVWSSEEVSWRALEVGRRSGIAGAEDIGSLVAFASRTDLGLDHIEFHGVSGSNQITLGDFRGESGAWQMRYRVAEGDYRTDFDPFQDGVQPLFVGSGGVRISAAALGLTVEDMHTYGGDIEFNQYDDDGKITISGELDATSATGPSGDILITASNRDDLADAGPDALGITLTDATLTGGDITLSVLKNNNKSRRQVFAIDSNATEITIENSTITASGEVSITASSQDLVYSDVQPDNTEDAYERAMPEWLSYPIVKGLSGGLNLLFDGVLPIPVSFAWRRAEATIDIEGSTITSHGNLTVKSQAVAHSSMISIASRPRYMKQLGAGQTSRILNTLSAGLSYAKGMAQTTIRGSLNSDGDVETESVLTSAAGDVRVESIADVVAEVVSRTTKNINTKAPVDVDGVSLAFSVTVSDTTATTTVDTGSHVTADAGNVRVIADGLVKNSGSATASSYVDGLGGVTVAVGVDEANVEAKVGEDASITSTGGSTVAQSLDTDAIQQSDPSRLTIPGHAFRNGDRVRYLAESPDDPTQGPTLIGGLVADEQLVVRVIDADTIQLVRAEEIDLSHFGADPDAVHSLALSDSRRFDPADVTQLSLGQDRFLFDLPGADLETGLAVQYRVRPPTNFIETDPPGRESEPIDGLYDGLTYFTIFDPAQPDQFRLAETEADAAAGNWLDLSGPGLGDEHYFVYELESRDFRPAVDLDAASNTITVNTSGIETGDSLVYRSDPKIQSTQELSRSYGFLPEGISRELDPTGTIDFGEAVLDFAVGTLTIPNHGLLSGERVIYSSGEGQPIVLDIESEDDNGNEPVTLVDGGEYFVIRVDADTLQLAATLGEAGTNTALPLLDASDSGSQSLTAVGTPTPIVFDPSSTVQWSVVDTVKDSILFETPHGFVTGQRLTYTTGEDENGQPNLPIGGVESDLDYYAIALSDFELQLARSRDEALGDGTASSAIQVAVVASGFGYDSGFAAIVQQLNDDTYYDFDATLVQPSDIDSPDELNDYQVVVIGGSGNDTGEFSGFQTPLRNWVEAGGGLVMTGWGVYAAGGSGYSDLDAVVPVDLSALYSYITAGQVSIIQSHPITDGVGNFSLSTGAFVEYSQGGPQGTVLVTTNGEATVVVDEPVAGRSVYLGPVYAGSPLHSSELRSGDPDRLLENSVAWAAPRTAIDLQPVDLQPGATGSASALHQFSGHSVDVENDWIISPEHELETGQEVQYLVGDGTPVGPLLDGQTYYAVRLDANIVRLASSIEQASAAAGGDTLAYLDLGSSASGSMQALSTASTVLTVEATRSAPVVDYEHDTIELLDHGLQTDQKVNYQSGGGAAIGGLADNTDYLVIAYDEDHIQLKSLTGNAPIDLSDAGPETTRRHALRIFAEVELYNRADPVIIFDPTITAPVDVLDDSIRVVNHGLAYNEKVRYLSGDGSAIGGLVNGGDYFALVLDEDRIQLAATAGGAKIGLDLGTTSGLRHGIEIGSTLTQNDLPIGGLASGLVYYAIVDGETSLRL